MNFVKASLLALALATPAKANHYMASADPSVVAAFQQLMQVYGGACQGGHQGSCQAFQMLDQEAATTLNAGYQCAFEGNQQSCGYYQYSIGQLQQLYTQTEAAIASSGGNYANGGTYGTTHAQRMQQIQDWGQQRLEIGRQNSALMDQRHNSFMEMLRQ